MTLHGTYEGPCHEIYLTEEILTLNGVNGFFSWRSSAHEVGVIEVRLVVIPCCGHTIKIARVVYVQAPELTRLVPSIVG